MQVERQRGAQGREIYGVSLPQADNLVFLEEDMGKLSRIWTWMIGLALMLPALAPSLALAAKKKADVVIVADTRKLDGILYWWAEMYNESHFLFAIMTMIIIPLVGCVLGWLADIVMSHIGIDLKHREIAEK